jgi:hypothetical protein
VRGGVFASGRNRAWKPKKHRKHPLPEEKRGRSEKGLANLWSRKKITKKARACREHETKWEISIVCGLSIKDNRTL